MVRKLLIMATAALAISSCTQVEVDDVATTPREPICFEQFVGKATRATDVTATNLNQYWIYGKIVRSDQSEETFTVNAKKSGGIWLYDKQMYWETGAKYYFTAANTPTTTSLQVTSDTDYGISVSRSNGGLRDFDLVTAICPEPIVGKSSGNSPVGLSFKHALAKVQFTITNGYGEEYTNITNTTFRIKGIKGSATTFSHNASTGQVWSGYDETPDYLSLNYISFPESGQSTTVSSLVFPQQLEEGAQLYFDIRMSRYGVRQSAGSVTVDIPRDVVSEWQPGHVYNYKLTIKSKEAVDFGVGSIEAWGEADDIDLGDQAIGAK